MHVCTSLAVPGHLNVVVPLESGICPTSAAWSHHTDLSPCHGVTWGKKIKSEK